jgi:bifunctional DNA-binding transcriptional regulator/antitoxin component of YhaV-PrlF toxin-antitoxin module
MNMSDSKPMVVRDRFQVTLPQDFRETMGIEVGQVLDCRFEHGALVVRPAELRRREPARRPPKPPKPTKAQLEARKRANVQPLTDEDLEELERDAVEISGPGLTDRELNDAIEEGRE